jgi:hypothetical protein
MIVPVFPIVLLVPDGAGVSEATLLAEAGVRRTIAAMQSAAARADSGGYMALVDTTDPVFAEEQRKWARDLRTRPVDSIELRADGTPRPEADGFWTVPVTIAWTLPGSEEPRGITYDARFRPVGLPDGAWLYAGRVWDERHEGGVRILLHPGDPNGTEMADYLAERAGPILASVEAELEETLDAEPTIKIYPDMASLQASIALSYTDPLGGWNEPGESIKLLGRPGFAGPRMEPTVAHELGHAVSFEYGSHIITAPWWVLEGIAEIAGDPFRARPLDNAAPHLARRGELIDFTRLADFRGEAMNHGRQVYTQGRSMLAYISQRWDRTTRNDWIRAMARGETLDEATRSVLGLSFEELDRDWRTWLLETPEPAPAE